MKGQSILRSAAKSFVVSGAATFGAMSGMVAFSYVIGKYVRSRPVLDNFMEQAKEVIDQAKEDIQQAKENVQEPVYDKEPEIEESLKEA